MLERRATPKVSVVMSVYNGERYLRQAVESILHQTFHDFEFIVINDGSTDGTPEILRSLDDNRIVLVENPHRLGLAQSLNKGLRIAGGKYIARMDADDISYPMRLAVEVQFLDTHSNIALIGTAYASENQTTGKTIVARHPATDLKIRELLCENTKFCHGSVMARRECLLSIGGYRSEFPVSQDYDLFVRVAEAYEMANLEEVLYQRHEHPHTASSSGGTEQSRYRNLARELALERARSGVDRFGYPFGGHSRSTACVSERAATRQRFFWGKWLYDNGKFLQGFALMLHCARRSGQDRWMWRMLVWDQLLWGVPRYLFGLRNLRRRWHRFEGFLMVTLPPKWVAVLRAIKYKVLRRQADLPALE